ncbi:helix-turn-helix domain-containing protein [Phenylobacterium sp.]|uniref:helix-turn-helix domain-containing protein n=1 Tax=Phenylobacterium sp. TaxID=1871053 RepID=UPI003983B743
MERLDADRSPNPVDRHVGLRIRMRRKELGVSQEKLADSIGLTFQQVQKYERAANRASASKLWEMARAMNTSIGYFYEGLGDPSEPGTNMPRETVQDFLMTSEGLELAATFPRITQPRVRRKVLELVRALAGDEPA